MIKKLLVAVPMLAALSAPVRANTVQILGPPGLACGNQQGCTSTASFLVSGSGQVTLSGEANVRLPGLMASPVDDQAFYTLTANVPGYTIGEPPFFELITSGSNVPGPGICDDRCLGSVSFDVAAGTGILTVNSALQVFSEGSPAAQVGSPAFDLTLTSADVTFTATPLPATLPLFATGLGALGLLGWFRKRKASGSLLGAA
jgi:hypothetical protein